MSKHQVRVVGTESAARRYYTAAVAASDHTAPLGTPYGGGVPGTMSSF